MDSLKSRLNSRQIKEFKALCKIGSIIEYTCLGKSDKGKVSGEGFMGGVKVIDGHGISHVISDYGLSTGNYTKLVVNGKKII